ncbi:MAG: DUF4331 domain-containing protein [Acidobacteria bacterium]|nr:DUF4331 domain-containing protein [Acidobacteriota bacterium]
MKHLRRTPPALGLGLLGLGLLLLLPPAWASSHREAPGITRSPQVDGADFFMFRSYEPGRQSFVTLIADYNPLQDAYGGPNYFALDPDAFYDIHVDNDGDAVEDLTFRFRFAAPSSFLSIPVGGEVVPIPLVNAGQAGPGLGTGALNQKRFYTVRLIRGSVDSPAASETLLTNGRTGGQVFSMPLDNIGRKSFPDYAGYANARITPIDFPGCGTGKVFAGQRKEPFQVNLGEIFDLVNVPNPLGAPDGRPSATADKNVTALALEVPIDCLTDGGPVIGGWTTARLPRNRALSETPTYETPDRQRGDYVQVSRLGNPLVNEVVIGLPDKNLFNASHPRNDGNFLRYVTNPVLPELLEILFGVEAPNNFPRNDLVTAFLTGVPGLNDTATPSEMLRLNTSVDPTPAAQQDFLGVLGGDAAGFPNGRRPGDDTVDIALRVTMGALCHLGIGCEPDDAPAGLLPFTDQAFQDVTQFDNAFPYLRTPLPGSPSM